jgi:SAM-dependent methyltransferase
MRVFEEHPRLARLIERGAKRTLAAVDSADEQAAQPVAGAPPQPEPAPPETAPEPPMSFERDVPPGNFVEDNQSVSRLLYERLSEQDLSSVQDAINEHPELALAFAEASTLDARVALILAYGMWLRHPAVVAKTGLSAEPPPEDIHAMARGPLAAAGGLYEADFVVNALASAGVELADMGTALDFGCSSGRVVGVLAAAYPEIQWNGCDPNEPAIAWATENLPGIEFFVNDNAPPLPLADGSLDMAYAISIWSHFAPGLGLGWFEEMHRLIRPGGHLVCTTHGLTSVAYSAAHGRSQEQVEEILDALYRQGSWYAPEFGEEGDWGVVNPDWGTAFLSPEWMLTQLCPRWRVLEFAPGRNQENQDVYVLQRV